MKILLFGEFSGVHNNLKDGLVKNGHNVIIVSNGDGFKKLKFDVNFCPHKGSSPFSALKNILHFLFNIRFFIFNDVVQFINPLIVPHYFKKIGLLKLIFLLNKRTIYYACGTDIDFINSLNKFKYFPFDDINHVEFPNYKQKHHETHYYFMKNIDNVVPSMYQYSFRKDLSKQLNPILLPGSIKTSESNNDERYLQNKKLNILFGITRENFKGVDYILESLNLIKEKYNDRVDINIVKKIPIDEYFNYLDQADILIDQCKSYDYGMNAILAMERKIIVLSGSEIEANIYNKVKRNPVINIKPNSSQIYQELEKLILMSDIEINSLKLDMFNHVTEYHNNNKITNNFIEIYK